jgi:hypothetical protein
MNRVPFILSTIALAILAGCATESGVTSAPAPAAAAPAQPAYVVAPAGTVLVPQAGTMVVAPAAPAAPAATALRAGFGRIDSITSAPNAAGGATAKPSSRVVMRMEDGSTQYFDTQAVGMAVGDRIEITPNGTMRHPA